MVTGKVDWYAEQVLLRVDKATDELLDKVALQVAGQAKINIRDNGQIDTGFMVNSVYTVTRKGSGYSQALAEALTQIWSKKKQKNVNHSGDMGPEIGLPENAKAGVAVGAEYAIYQEIKRSFLYKALEQVVPQVGGAIEKVKT